MGDISDHFSRVEFACRCGCGFDRVDPALILLLEATRAIYGRRMVVLSGCRCETHNEASYGSVASQHLGLRWSEDGEELERECHAADIAVGSTEERHALTGAFLRAGASGVGVAKGFIHGDCGIAGRGVVRPALWTY